MRVSAYQRPKTPKRPPTPLERKLATYYDLFTNFTDPEKIVDDFTEHWGKSGAKIVDAYDNVFLAWFPSQDIAVELYYTCKRHSWGNTYPVTDVIQCPDYYTDN